MEYIQVGVTALRNPLTGEMLPAVPLYVRKEDARKGGLKETEEQAADGWARDLARMMKEYVDGCRTAKVPI